MFSFTPVFIGLSLMCVGCASGLSGDDDDLINDAFGLVASPERQSFGQVPVGATSAALAFEISSSKSAGRLIVEIEGNDYVIQDDSCSNRILESGETCDVLVSFVPSESGETSNQLVVEDGVSTTVIELSGEGVLGGSFQITPAVFDFGDIELGDSSELANFAVLYTGTANSGTIELQSNDERFEISATDCTTLEDQESCAFQVIFTPFESTNSIATVSIGNGADTSVVSVGGRGLAPLRSINVFVSGNSSGTVRSTQANVECQSNCSGYAREGETVFFSAQNTGGGRFDGWSGGFCGGYSTSCSFVVTEDATVRASFRDDR